MSGFQKIGSISGAEPHGVIQTFDVVSTHSSILAVGDVVDITGTGSATGRQGVDAASATGQMLGVVVGFEVDPDTLNSTGLAASTAGVARVDTDPNSTYRVTVSNGPLASTDIGLNCDSVVTAATVSGGLTRSNMTVNATGVATTVTFPWRIIALEEDSDGTYGNVAIVAPNSTVARAGTVGA